MKISKKMVWNKVCYLSRILLTLLPFPLNSSGLCCSSNQGTLQYTVPQENTFWKCSIAHCFSYLILFHTFIPWIKTEVLDNSEGCFKIINKASCATSKTITQMHPSSQLLPWAAQHRYYVIDYCRIRGHRKRHIYESTAFSCAVQGLEFPCRLLCVMTWELITTHSPLVTTLNLHKGWLEGKKLE